MQPVWTLNKLSVVSIDEYNEDTILKTTR